MKNWLSSLVITVFLALLALAAWQWGDYGVALLDQQGERFQSLDSLVALFSALGSGISGFFTFLAWRGQKTALTPLPPVNKTKISTDGGAYVGGNVQTGGGDFTGRDKTTSAGQGGVAAGGNISDSTILQIQELKIEHVAQQVWQGAKPKLDEETLRAATQIYLQYIHDRHAYLTMKGMGTAENVPVQLKLLDLYVPLKARREVPKGETWERSLKLAGRQAAQDDPEALQAMRLGEPQPLLDILKDKDGVIILGDPGAGKTTFLKFLALKLARGEGQSLGLDGRLPILLPLAAYANVLVEKNIRLDAFIGEYFDNIGCDFPLGPMLSEALASGKALLLLDGLDEVKDLALRNTVVERVTDFYSAHRRKGNKFVLTSRVVGYRAVRSVADGMAECTLVDFDDDEIAEFISHWTSALEKQALGDTAVARHDAEQERRELLEAMQNNDGVRRLAANPLLLTILALMKRKGVTLPERRVQLYDQYVKTLLSTWNRARSMSGRATGRDLDEVQTTRVLAPLALWMHEVNPGVGLVKRPDLHRKLEEIFSSRSAPDPEAASAQFLSDVREHAALLLERGADEYGFIHLTFEEYLAAVALAFKAQGDPQPIVTALAPHIGEQAWREVALLVVSYVGIIQNLPRVAGQVLEGLAQVPGGAPAEAAVLAGEAALDALPDGITPASAARVIEALIPAMQDPAAKPDLRRRAGLALGKLGWKPDDLDEFVEIQPGKFLYGDKKEEQEIKHPYWVAKYPVTNLQFARFFKAGGYDNPDWWSKDGWDWRTDKYETKATESYEKDLLARRPLEQRNQPQYWDSAKWNNPIAPVVGISWFEAQAYCNWLNSQPLGFNLPKNYQLRLPTELEWERAARFNDGREYPWQGEFDFSRANVAEELGRGDGTTAVCAYPLGQSQEGVFDLSGNVWEWSADWFEKGKRRSLRGGSWDFSGRLARCASRGWYIPDTFRYHLGFRCVVSLAISDF
ncbi:MAG: SUMF1/EgtB/PvdO family nonheme iron enzyme [Anaerolineales bacterium]|jgi:formylglycine-generating enzyme required for sulfatase activity|nr:SUMF1/EgtB/PvdO family nonheme iron enzyme [Anaerolineales bacterium]